MRNFAYIGALIAALTYGCSKHQMSNDDKESPLSSARAANEQIQLAIAASNCSDSDEPQGLCMHLKQAQAEVDNTIYRINGSHE
jgi:hypothetical protein